MQKSKYQQSVSRLRNYLEKNELERQRWAHEFWAHPNGNWFKISRIFVPIAALFGLIVLAIHLMIRFAQTQSVYYEVDERAAFLYIIPTFVVLIGSVVGAVLLALNKQKSGAFVSFFSSLMIIVSVFTQFNVYTPDNSSFDGGAVLDYTQLCTLIIVLYAVILFLASILCGILIKEKRELDRMVENNIIKITNNKTGLNSQDDYCVLIDEYLEKTNIKQKEKD